MDVSNGASLIYRFGSFEADTASGELRKKDVRIKLQEHMGGSGF